MTSQTYANRPCAGDLTSSPNLAFLSSLSPGPPILLLLALSSRSRTPLSGRRGLETLPSILTLAFARVRGTALGVASVSLALFEDEESEEMGVPGSREVADVLRRGFLLEAKFRDEEVEEWGLR